MEPFVKNDLSHLGRTWLLDLDGVLVKHRSALTNPKDLLPGVREFFETLDPKDLVFIVTARTAEERPQIRRFFRKLGFKIHRVVCGATTGLRTLVNDLKPDGSVTAKSINVVRNQGNWHTL